MRMQRFCAVTLLTFVAFHALAAKPPAKKPAPKSKATQQLIEAATAADEDHILAALAAGADPNARDEDNYTPLILCAPQSLFGKERQIVEAFVKAKVKIDAVNKDGASALMAAASGGRDGMVRLLIENNAKVDLRDNDGWTALMYASSVGQWGVVKELIEAKADVNVVSKTGWSPLMLSLYQGRGAAAEQLLKAGAKMPEKAPNGLTAILLATYGRDLQCIRQVLESGQPIDGLDADGWPAVEVAAYNGDGQIVMELLRAGADPTVKDKEGKNALDRAREHERTEIIALLGGPWDVPKPKRGQSIVLPCAALGGNVDVHFELDGTTLEIITTFPKPYTYYLGGGNTNRAKSATKYTYEGSFAPTYYFDIDSNSKTGRKADPIFKEAAGSEYDIDYSQYGTSVSLEYKDSEGKEHSKTVYANVLDVSVEKEGEMIDVSEVPDVDRPGALNYNGILITRVPLSLMNLTPGKTVRVTAKIPSCGDAVVAKVKL
jgi:ankyrin repeat protein